MDSALVFDNPLVGRYASPEMASLWSPQRKFSTWRRLWLALAEAQLELGLMTEDGSRPRITELQLAEMKAHLDDIDFQRADLHECRLRHDVMAHIETFGERCPNAREIIHLGATSCYVTDNTDLLLLREGLRLIRDRLVRVLAALARFARQHRTLACLGYTHYQPAQMTTLGKRTCLWLHDFFLDLEEIEHRLETLKFRGVKGTTGTQASFLTLFKGDQARVRQLDRLVAQKMGFSSVYPVTGQTYTRKIDSQILDVLSGLGQSAHKFGSDLRLLSHDQELDEPFEKDQVGSSAMAYKRNPMRCERMCGLGRFVMSLASSAAQTAANQWLERTLDDSVNRRLILPQSFLATDGMLRLALNVSQGMQPNAEVIARRVAQYYPYMVTENLMMAAVARGADRQTVHKIVRDRSQEVTQELKGGLGRNDLLERLQREPVFSVLDFREVLDQTSLIGRSAEQVEEFLQEVIDPVLSHYSLSGSSLEQLSV